MQTLSHHLHTENEFCWGHNGLRIRPITTGASSTVYSRIITRMLVLMRGTITPIQHWFNTAATSPSNHTNICISRMSVGSDLV